ncbi:unnamed protein product [Effrenium voratum]|nr:unnamed protein product [Effrenium voratum]
MGNFAELTVQLGQLKETHRYARSSLFEQTTPTGLLLEDTNASVSSTGFADLDLDAKEVGGQVTWNLPEDLAQVTGLEVYLLGAERSQVASLKALTSADILPDTATQDFTQVAVFTRSALTEQTTPGTAAALWDAWALAEDVTFVDQDLDALELAGNVSWVPNRTVNAAVSGYQVYLSNSSTGFGPGEHVTTEGPEADIATVPADIPLSTLRYVQVDNCCL